MIRMSFVLVLMFRLRAILRTGLLTFSIAYMCYCTGILHRVLSCNVTLHCLVNVNRNFVCQTTGAQFFGQNHLIRQEQTYRTFHLNEHGWYSIPPGPGVQFQFHLNYGDW